MSIGTRALVLVALVLVADRASPFAQDPAPKKVEHSITPSADHQQMEQLIREVETHLRQIDTLLGDAGAGDKAALAKVGPSGLAGLLKHSQDDVREVVDDIDRILELADHVHPPGT